MINYVYILRDDTYSHWSRKGTKKKKTHTHTYTKDQLLISNIVLKKIRIKNEKIICDLNEL